VVTNIFRYVIVERDRIIAMKISDICNKISKENENNNHEISDVVCVLGMLHSNGVVRYLLEE
jgi:pheromone shutdown protein TraB